MKLIDIYHADLLKRHAEANNGQEGMVFFSDFNFLTFFENYTYAKKNRVKSRFHVEALDLQETNIPHFSWPPNKQKNIPEYANKTGMYRITFVEKGTTYYGYHATFITGYKSDVIHLTCLTPAMYLKVSEMNKKSQHKQGRPPVGTYTGACDQQGVLRYSKYNLKDGDKTVTHKVKANVLKDIEHFFKNLPNSIKHGEKGTRKVLLAGPQGTGKSSIIQEILRKYSNNKSSTFVAQGLDALAQHIQGCAKYKLPCITILEDCETWLNEQKENSNALNFLSGALEPKNEGGTYIIMTTNHPDRLSDRIKHRPERIDEIFIIDSLDENDALAVAKMYFGQYLPEDFKWETLRGVFTGCTGAEIMKFAQDVKKDADYKLGGFDKVDRKFIEKAMQRQMNKYKELEKISTGKTKIAQKQGATEGNLGFGFGRGFDDFEDD